MFLIIKNVWKIKKTLKNVKNVTKIKKNVKCVFYIYDIYVSCFETGPVFKLVIVIRAVRYQKFTRPSGSVLLWNPDTG